MSPPVMSDPADLRILRSLLGASFEVSTTEHFAIVHPPQTDYLSRTGGALEWAYSRFYQAFSKAGFELTPSTDRLVWICFPHQAGFDEYTVRAEGMDLSWLDGYYSTLTNRVAIVQQSPGRPKDRGKSSPETPEDATLVANAEPIEGVLPMSADGPHLDLARLTHELAHQLAFNSGLQNRGVMYPFWVSEGLATNFEFDSLTGTGFEGSSTSRRAYLVRTYAAGELMPLPQFVVQTSAPADICQSRRQYAQAWAFFRCLLTERSELLRTYLRRAAGLPPGPRSARMLLREFTEAFGAPESIEDSWYAFLDRQVREQQEQNARPATP
jgi:hypothetical protein